MSNLLLKDLKALWEFLNLNEDLRRTGVAV
jgi:hypothetical protein